MLISNEGHMFGSAGQGFIRVNLACPTHVIEASLDRLLQAVKDILPKV
ncbi:MAG: hypothetical protein GX345_08640 [Clostridiales bacterium]|nr:hypothetical protein [Clostridiales bacterium]